MESAGMTRRLAAILVADVVDYSLMMGEDEHATIALIRELRESSLEPVALRHRGAVLKRMGDGWVIAFQAVGDAVDCAMEVQNGLVGHLRTRLRIGIHMGDIVQDEADVYGAGVNLAARLQTEAPPGGVLISGDVHRQLSAKQARAFRDAGAFKLKNITQPVVGFQWRPEGILPGRRVDKVPVISVEPFAATPDDSATRSAAADVRDQMFLALSRRTGVRVCDGGPGHGGNATYLLRGRLRHFGGRGRLNVSIVLREDGGNVWSGVFEEEAPDLLAFCDEVAMRADTELRFQTNALDGERIAEMPDEALSCSELRSRAASLFYKASIRSWERSMEVLARALRLNPEDPMAMAMEAEGATVLNVIRHQAVAPAEIARLASALDRAVEAAPRCDYFYFVRAELRVHLLQDAEGALSDVRRCLKLNPGYAPIHEIEGLAHLQAGRFHEAVSALRMVVEALPNDPLTTYRSYLMAIAQLCDRDPTAAARTMRGLLDFKPDVRAYRTLLALVLRDLGDEAGALREEAAAGCLPDGPNFHAPRPPLPDDRAWLVQALAPAQG